ncbi:MAG: 50S ribosomal protein L30 [Saprospiraceae bacterium]|nr:50S ribosomal protein L30 [Saprospiraceae bacterium]MBK7812260.1 50S ribosomal protein L30 [Saprospiraceae bacterium]MBK9632519.1 50S ribosomal protein L30 [Saprospiraceae bacterium]
MSKLRIKQVRSIIKASDRQKKTIEALGLKSLHDAVELSASPSILGMLDKVKHLVTVEKI